MTNNIKGSVESNKNKSNNLQRKKDKNNKYNKKM